MVHDGDGVEVIFCFALNVVLCVFQILNTTSWSWSYYWNMRYAHLPSTCGLARSLLAEYY